MRNTKIYTEDLGISFGDLKELVKGFRAYGTTQKGRRQWFKNRGSEIDLPNLLEEMRQDETGEVRHNFFYSETHTRPDYVDSGTNVRIVECRTNLGPRLLKPLVELVRKEDPRVK